jgi:hypothetical protein
MDIPGVIQSVFGVSRALLGVVHTGRLPGTPSGGQSVTPALLRRLQGEGIADKELSALLARDQLVPIVHETTYEALREVSPLLGAKRPQYCKKSDGLTSRPSSPS